jgi:hypothetical protein
MEADPELREDRRQVDLDILWLAPAHRDPWIGWNELEPFALRDNIDVDLAAELLAKLESHRNAADPGAQNDNTRHISLLCSFSIEAPGPLIPSLASCSRPAAVI